MPLEKINDSTIKEAYSVLSEISEAIKQGKKADLNVLSSKFYCLIAHDFGFQKMSIFLLDSQQKVKQKILLLETLQNIKISIKILSQIKDDDDVATVDQMYMKLKCNINPLDKNSQDYKILCQYMDNSKGYSKVKVISIYEVLRQSEEKIFQENIGNNILLWYDCELVNFVAILSQGLRIPPPQAPVQYYSFGKGIYLSDMAEKSIGNFKRQGFGKAFIFLVEAAVGDPLILTNQNFNAKQEVEKYKKNSAKFNLKVCENHPNSYTKLKNATIPIRKSQSPSQNQCIGHNEYIIYNINQIIIRYLIEIQINGQ